jgi:hypothetical protein
MTVQPVQQGLAKPIPLLFMINGEVMIKGEAAEYAAGTG